MLEKFGLAIVALTRSIVQMFGYELAVKIKEHSINLDFVDPDALDERAYDDNHFVSGNIFVGEYANPINITNIKNAYQEADYIVSERYKEYMEQELIDDIIQSSKDSKLTITQATLILGALQMVSVAVIYVVG